MKEVHSHHSFINNTHPEVHLFAIREQCPHYKGLFRLLIKVMHSEL